MEIYKETPPAELLEYEIEFFSSQALHPKFTAVAHMHDTVEILFITEGEFTVYIDEEQVAAQKGDIVILRSNAVHSIYHPHCTESCYDVLKLSTALLFSHFKGGDGIECIIPFLRRQKGLSYVIRGSGVTPKVRSLISDMHAEYKRGEVGTMALLKAYALELVVRLYREVFHAEAEKDVVNIFSSKKMLSLIRHSLEYIGENYASEITAADCAAKVNLSYSYYAKLFRTVTGKTFKEYLTELRLAKAHSILLLTNLSVTDVSLACGYKNLSHFTAEYKKMYGMPPRETRKI